MASAFADSDKLAGLYEATYAAVGQVYLDLIESVLNKSVLDVNIFQKKYWEILAVKNTDIFGTGDTSYPYGVYLDKVYDSLTTLNNSVLTPESILERYIDFDLIGRVTKPDETIVSALKFKTDPFTSGTNGGVLDGFAWKFTPNTDVILYSGTDGIASGTTFKLIDNAIFDQVHVGLTLKVKYGNGTEQLAKIVSFVSSQEVTLDTSLSNDTRVSWWVQVDKEKQISFWAPDVGVDVDTLYNNFGAITNIRQVSSSAYKELLKGIYLFYTKGPILGHIESVVNVLHGFPLVKTEGEVLQKYESNIDTINDRITTDKNVYLVPVGYTRSDIQDPNNIGILTFKAFESLSTLAQVKDFTSDPFWWWNIVVPGELLGSNETNQRLHSKPNLFDFTVGTPEYPVKIGDLGLNIGTKLIQRHAYLALYTYLKYHLLGVLVDAYPALLTYDEILDTLQGGKLPESYVYLQPYKNLTTETLSVTEIFSYTPEVVTVESFPPQDALLTIGGGWSISDYYWYDTANTIATANGTANQALGQTPYAISGNDPSVVGNLGTVDWPVQVTVV